MTQLWSVDAPLLQTSSQPLTACGVTTASKPPAGCGGAPVAGVDPSTLPGYHVHANGTVTTGSVHLVGTWDGSLLTVTQPPGPPGAPRQETPPMSEKGPTASEQELMSLQQQLVDELPARGFPVLVAGLSGDPQRVEVQVTAATPEQAASLSADYGGLLVVTSFLTPL